MTNPSLFPSDSFVSSKSYQGFANPHFDIATTYLPRDIKKTFDWCEFIFFTNPILKSAIERIVQYFITEITISSDKDSENSEELLRMLKKRMPEYICSGIDTIVYGNSIEVAYMPFNRYLICPECGMKYNSEQVNFDFVNGEFHKDCICGYSGKMIVSDEKDANLDRVHITRKDPRTLKVDYSDFNGVSTYYWDTEKEDQLATAIRTGRPNKEILKSIPMEILESVISGNSSFSFKNKYVHHIKAPSIAGVSKQYGFPPLLTVMKLNFYNATLRRANEATALDYILPFRVLSPAQSSANADPLVTHNMGKFRSAMSNMVFRHRLDPGDIQISPYPINYQAFGAERKALDSTPEIRQSNDEMLHGLNFPAELFFNSLQFQAMPPALRLFENTWKYLILGINERIQWEADLMCEHMAWEKIDVKMTKVSIADDIEKRQVMLSLSQAGLISNLTSLKQYGLDFEDETRNMALEQKMVSDIQQEIARQMRDEMAMAGPDAGGQAAQPGDVNAEIEMMAQELLNTPMEARRSHLYQLKQSDPTKHALVRQKMTDIRQAHSTQQMHQALAANGMGGAMMPPGQSQ